MAALDGCRNATADHRRNPLVLVDHAASTVVLFLISIAVTLALSAGGALHVCLRLLETRGRSGMTVARALFAGIAGGGSGAFIGTVGLLLIPPIRRSWESIAAEVALQMGAGLLLGSVLGLLYYLVVRGGVPLNRPS